MTTAVKRAMKVMTDWHVDEIVDRAAARIYAKKLLERLKESGIVLVLANKETSRGKNKTKAT